MLLQQLEQQVGRMSRARFLPLESEIKMFGQVQGAGVQNEALNKALADLRQML